MNAILRSAIAVVLVASPLSAQQRNFAQKLGYPANAKLLILHADDLGVAHSVNAASLEALSKGAISSGNLKPGVSEIIVHLGFDDAELKAVMVNHEPWGAAWRQRDYDVVSSPEFKKALKDNNVILVKWKHLYRAAQMP